MNIPSIKLISKIYDALTLVLSELLAIGECILPFYDTNNLNIRYECKRTFNVFIFLFQIFFSLID